MKQGSTIMTRRVYALLLDFALFCFLYWLIFYVLLEPLCSNTYLSVTCSSRYLGLWMSFLGVYVWANHWFKGASLGEHLAKIGHAKMSFVDSLVRSKIMMAFGIINGLTFTCFLLGNGPDGLVFVWFFGYPLVVLFLLFNVLLKRPERFPVRSI